MSHDSSARSWNDPPQLKFEEVSQSTNRHILNKRVFPSFNKQGVILGVAPPFPQTKQTFSAGADTSIPKTNTTLKSETEETIPDCQDVLKEDTLQVYDADTSLVKNNTTLESTTPQDKSCDLSTSNTDKLSCILLIFKNILCEAPEKSEKTRKEIDRRIMMFEKSWDSQLSIEVKEMMFQLAQELSNGNIDAALKIHCILMVHNVREVKNWMVGVKHLIELKKNTSKQ